MWLNLLKTVSDLYGVYVLLGLTVFIILAILSIFFVSIFTKTPFSLGFGLFKINFGHKGLPLNKDGLISGLLEFQEIHIKEIVEIENATLKRQISYTEQKLTQLKYILTKNYSAALSKKLSGNEDVKLHKDYRSYQILIGMLITNLVDKVFTVAFVENHFDELNEEAWKDYLDDKSNYILNFMSDFLDNMYADGRLVTRQESYEEESKSYDEVKEILKSIFENARESALQSKAEIKKEKEESDNHIKQICKSNGFEIE